MRALERSSEAPVLELIHADRWLIARFPEPQAMLSWAIVGGGRVDASAVAWRQVHDLELGPAVCPRALLRGALDEAGLTDAVGLLTSRALDRYEDVTVRYGSVAARAVATVGLGNALRAGDPPGRGRVGTINVLCHVSTPLSEEALVEALALAAEARTAAVLEAGIASRRTGRPATGTGTDCVVVAAPRADGGAPYAGKHTPVGHVLGASVTAAVRRGIERWTRERRARGRAEARIEATPEPSAARRPAAPGRSEAVRP